MAKEHPEKTVAKEDAAPKKPKQNPTWHALVWRKHVTENSVDTKLEILERKNSLELRRAIAEDSTIDSVHLVFRGRIVPFKKTVQF